MTDESRSIIPHHRGNLYSVLRHAEDVAFDRLEHAAKGTMDVIRLSDEHEALRFLVGVVGSQAMTHIAPLDGYVCDWTDQHGRSDGRGAAMRQAIEELREAYNDGWMRQEKHDGGHTRSDRERPVGSVGEGDVGGATEGVSPSGAGPEQHAAEQRAAGSGCDSIGGVVNSLREASEDAREGSVEDAGGVRAQEHGAGAFADDLRLKADQIAGLQSELRQAAGELHRSLVLTTDAMQRFSMLISQASVAVRESLDFLKEKP